MLRSLHIKNIALISSQDFEFCDGFNVLSGETGAGKSIIVDSLMLVMGGKFDKTLIRYGESFARVEAEFDTTKAVEELLAELDIDVDDVTVITRKITQEGRSENRINGRIVTLSMIKQVASLLVDICGQHEYQYLSSISNHIKLLDYYVRHSTEDLLIQYRTILSEFKEIKAKLIEVGSLKERDENVEFLRKQLNEINKVNLKEGEEDELLALRKKYQYSEKILNALSEAGSILSDDNDSAISKLISASKILSSISQYDEEYSVLSGRMESLIIELEDISETVSDKLNELDFDNDDIDELENRLAKIKELTRKYGSVDGALEYAKKLEEKISFLENADDLIEEYSLKKNKLLSKLYGLAANISDIRRKGACAFEQNVVKELSDLGMEHSQFKVVFADLPDLQSSENKFTSNGLDNIEFYLSPNVGQPLLPLTKIISGGEQSRLMLALKVIAGETDVIPTLIFDEIDVGISGKVGLEVAKKMAKISFTHQVLCVTHLAQIAAMADANYFISKSVVGDQTITSVEFLGQLGQYDEIARLSGWKDISDNAVESAKQMKEWSTAYKDELKSKK